MLTRELIKTNFTRIPTLRTPRLCLRKILPSDLDAMHTYAKKEEVSRYLLWSPHPTRDYTARYLQYLQDRYTAGDFYDWAIVPNELGHMIGTCGFTRFDYTNNSAEVGYVLSPDHHGKGYATEALLRVLSFGFHELNLHRIEAHYLENNLASRRVMERVGMTFEGISRGAIVVKGRYENVGICSILREEYENS